MYKYISIYNIALIYISKIRDFIIFIKLQNKKIIKHEIHAAAETVGPSHCATFCSVIVKKIIITDYIK